MEDLSVGLRLVLVEVVERECKSEHRLRGRERRASVRVCRERRVSMRVCRERRLPGCHSAES